MAKRKSGRDVHGILLLDKRLGVSSNKALQEVRRLFNANKAGHTGSLDPLATGLLPLCFGEATKVSALMLDDDKRYQVVVRLGVMTDTGDAEGQVVKQLPVPELTEQQIQDCLRHFTGEIEQVPPMYSALKHQGKKLYELAREGKVVDRKTRRITIFSLRLLGVVAGDCLSLDVQCSKGTYIRSLAEDIGHYLGCCATVKALRRTASGRFGIDQALTLEQLTAMDETALQHSLIAVDKPLESMPAVQVPSDQAERIRQGQQIAIDVPARGMVRMYCDQVFLGLGEMLLNGKIAPKKLFHLSSESA
ncbi:tRNA pseudouridine(55) synthase TruB [Methylomarinum sp. Ch1-1]|uniref:tRNA pseudouridine synthase B n=1 Tax=Methylomarinum roseum TaxID=3067653 RepID=A0AAU7NPE9_9GAMM|nr:tRNA pseudouridine(55) synthase TruB [Methylomarinum sp. Ch1-1]MDP4521279.1 tRNA pseudouridine(55) synthase TruB [Methylomarinum sp. Ch1-1]